MLKTLTHKTTYLFHNEPQIYTCTDEQSQLYLCLAEPNDQILIAHISEAILKQAEQRQIQLRDIFLNSSILYLKTNTHYLRIHPEHLTDEMLPLKNEYLI